MKKKKSMGIIVVPSPDSITYTAEIYNYMGDLKYITGEYKSEKLADDAARKWIRDNTKDVNILSLA